MRKQKGFTLIELLIVVAIIGIIAAIAIPNLLDAIERSRQKRSTAEVKTLANAIQSFTVDYGGYPANIHSGPQTPGVGLADPAWVEVAPPVGNGLAVFIPDYLQALPTNDGWGIAYTADFGPDGATPHIRLGEATALHMTVGCFGNDRQPTAGIVTDPLAADYVALSGAVLIAGALPAPLPGALQTHCYMTDIVWFDSSFMQAPDGKQKNCN